MAISLFGFLVMLLFGLEVTYAMTEAQIKAAQNLAKRSCKSRNKITSDEELDGMLQGKWDNLSRASLCYLNCCLQIMKLIKSDGHIDMVSAMKQTKTLSPERQIASETSIEKCKDAGMSLTDKCEIAYEIGKCLYFDNPKNYLVP